MVSHSVGRAVDLLSRGLGHSVCHDLYRCSAREASDIGVCVLRYHYGTYRRVVELFRRRRGCLTHIDVFALVTYPYDCITKF